MSWPTYSATQIASSDIRRAFFKCLKWQVEETLDPFACPFHYYCETISPAADYPSWVDVLVILFAAASFLVTVIVMVLEASSRGGKRLVKAKQYFLPSSPLSLSVTILVLSQGHSINSLFPISCIGPAVLQLVHIAALGFDHDASQDIKYVIFQTSTVSGILHASLYLDSIILPYYTGYDALVTSSFSGECSTCVCRRDILVVGGSSVTYRAWSVTTFLVVSSLCLRIMSRAAQEGQKIIRVSKTALETVSLALLAWDSIHLLRNSPPEKLLLQRAAFGAELALICTFILGRIRVAMRKQLDAA
ncbi:hypothetical protein MLD38_030956 [Melastoma candidum]|uniref:Uncharacterized protein n=1 Tax=Melastoma candidum TaxID=119954 RepID=A0ACB9MPH3_9MYRT|nr:hypothetical protein MLD38_030956 [Melastoma candidum]